MKHISKVMRSAGSSQKASDRIRTHIQQDQAQKNHADRLTFLRRWKLDPNAVREEFTWACPYCSRSVPPVVFEGHDGPLVRSGERCGCLAEKLDLEVKADQAREQRRLFNEERYGQRLARAGLAGWLTTATFETFQGREKAAVKRYCDALLNAQLVQPFLLLWGPVGTGKSHLAAACVHECLNAGWRNVYFRPWTRWLGKLMDSYGDDKIKSSEITDELASGRMIVLDDVDKQSPTKSGFAEGQLFLAINERYNKRLPTIITLNRQMTDPLVLAVLGVAGVDRIIGATGASQRIEFKGGSQRSGIQW